MLIVGELINTSRKSVKQAVESKDATYIQELAEKQVQAGAIYVDVNCGTLVDNEPEMMEWLVNTIQAKVQAPLCLDSPNPLALDRGLALCKYGQPMINSISGEQERFKAILPLVTKYKSKIVALCMDNSGMPETAKDRIKVASKLVSDLMGAGVSLDDIYLDPLIKPVGSGDREGVEVLESVSEIKAMFPEVHVICGLSNVSYGLPNRKVLNQSFMILTMGRGMDSYILDPLDNIMMGFVYSSQLLLGEDQFSINYLKAHRQGLFQK